MLLLLIVNFLIVILNFSPVIDAVKLAWAGMGNRAYALCGVVGDLSGEQESISGGFVFYFSSFLLSFST
jgi:hypothetical protein